TTLLTPDVNTSLNPYTTLFRSVCADSRTFFVTSKTHGGRALLQSERMATLFIDVLRSYHRKGVFTVHDFVVMPDHFHLLITVDQDRKSTRLNSSHDQISYAVFC